MPEENYAFKEKFETGLRDKEPMRPVQHWMESAESMVKAISMLEPEEQNEFVKFIYDSIKNHRIIQYKKAQEEAQRLDQNLGVYFTMIQPQ